jgi:argininosuccinate lyase
MVRCNVAHTIMLYEQHILAKKEAGATLGALKKLEKLTGNFPKQAQRRREGSIRW